MALTPGSYVPQGQVGTGAAYVHQIKDRSGYVEAMAEAAKKQRLEQEKQLAKLKGFDYGKVVDPVMKQHISEQYKKGLTAFSEVVAKGGDISNITTAEGIAFSDWQNNIKNEADTAARAEAMKSQFQTTAANNLEDYDVDIVNAAISSYDNATTPDQKLAAMVNFNPLYVRGFDYNKWINTQFDKAVKDVEVTDFGGDINKYQEVYNQKIDVLPDVLAVDPGYPIAELQWQRKKEKGEAGFQQENFGQFLTEQIDYQKTLRQNKKESVAAKPNTYNFNLGGSGKDESLYTTYSPYDVAQINPVPDNVATTAKVVGDKLVVKYGDKAPDFAATGLNSSLSSYYNSTDKQLEVPLSKLYQFPASGKGYTLPKKKTNVRSGQDANVKGTFFTVDGSAATSEVPSKVFKDRWGNVWIQLEGQNEFVPIEAGGSIYTTNSANITKFQEVAQQNRTALKNALGKDWTDTYAEFGFDSGATEDGQ
jgi:hypothetical protein